MRTQGVPSPPRVPTSTRTDMMDNAGTYSSPVALPRPTISLPQGVHSRIPPRVPSCDVLQQQLNLGHGVDGDGNREGNLALTAVCESDFAWFASRQLRAAAFGDVHNYIHSRGLPPNGASSPASASDENYNS